MTQGCGEVQAHFHSMHSSGLRIRSILIRLVFLQAVLSNSCSGVVSGQYVRNLSQWLTHQRAVVSMFFFVFMRVKLFLQEHSIAWHGKVFAQIVCKRCAPRLGWVSTQRHRNPLNNVDYALSSSSVGLLVWSEWEVWPQRTANCSWNSDFLHLGVPICWLLPFISVVFSWTS
jgi:hypothetical protein